MVNVAIAGGGGSVGRTILEMMGTQTQHKAFVLTRKPTSTNTGVPCLQVDYNNIESLTHILEENQIHTIICCVGYHGDSLRVAQLNLIKAATAASATKRFIPSTFAIAYPQDSVQELPTLIDYFGAIEELRKSGLRWTIVLNGCFLDYWAMPHLKSYLRPAPFAVDIAHRQAAIPGDGNTHVSFTYSFDMARFVVRLLDLDEWPEESRMAGDILTWNEFVHLAEKKLDCTFKVTYDSSDKLRNSEMTELPSQLQCYETIPKPQFRWFMSIFSRWTTDETICRVPQELNARFPDIKCMTAEEMLEMCWKGRP